MARRSTWNPQRLLFLPLALLLSPCSGASSDERDGGVLGVDVGPSDGSSVDGTIDASVGDATSPQVVCSDHSACRGGTVCGDNGKCQTNTSRGPCVQNENCVQDEHCVAGLCVPRGQAGYECARAEDCVAPLVCEPGPDTCRASVTCANSNQCGSGAICSSGTCVRNTPGGPCEESANCVRGESCVAGSCIAGCGGDFYRAERVPPNLMIAFDRSGSMADAITWGGDSKLQIAQDAVSVLLTDYEGSIHFGLSLFNSDGDCGARDLSVATGASTTAHIRSILSTTGPSGNTPIAGALYNLLSNRAASGLADPTRANYILLLTDGEETCRGNPEGAVTALRGVMPEVKTFVVGFGDGVDAEQLRAMAIAGGTALAGSPAYYQADNAASLRDAFDQIAGRVMACTYTLSDVPPDPNKLFVYFDRRDVPRDTQHSNGWDHEVGTNRLDFYGAACDALRSGQVNDVLVVYGCPLEAIDAGTTDGGDAGTDDASHLGKDADPGSMGCSTGCDCGRLGCIIPQGQSVGTCGPCTSNPECCPGSSCLNGVCVPDL